MPYKILQAPQGLYDIASNRHDSLHHSPCAQTQLFALPHRLAECDYPAHGHGESGTSVSGLHSHSDSLR